MNKGRSIFSKYFVICSAVILISFVCLGAVLLLVSSRYFIDDRKALLKKNGCNLVLANDITQISGDTHKAYLLDGDLAFEEFDTKQEIAQGIAARIVREVQA